MYKLFINNIQIGNYKTMENMMISALNAVVIKNGVKSVKWEGKTLIIKTND